MFRRAFLLLPLLAAPACRSRQADVFRSDVTAIRAQLRVPENARVAAYRASPMTPGTFGREGLRIGMIFQFDRAGFEAYLRRTDEPSSWTPVPFPGRSPSVESEHTPASLRWKPLPLPEPRGALARRFDRLAFGDEIRSVAGGRYLCTVSEYDVPAGKAPVDGTFKKWACDEFTDEHLAFTLAVLDPSGLRLLVDYQM